MIKTLEELYQSEDFHAWDSDNRSPASACMILEDPERFDRIQESAEYGCEGSTHQEIMGDWRAYLNELNENEADHDAINKEIDDCEEWHEKNGSLQNQGS